MAECAGEGGAEGGIAAATLALGLELTHPAREAAADAETPAMIERRVNMDIFAPNEDGVGGIYTL
jgi:hypothetical protein